MVMANGPILVVVMRGQEFPIPVVISVNAYQIERIRYRAVSLHLLRSEISLARNFSRINTTGMRFAASRAGGSKYEIRLFQQDRENLADIVVSGRRRSSINRRRTGAISSRSRSVLSARSGSQQRPRSGPAVQAR